MTRVTRKVGYSGVAGAITFFLIWGYGALQQALHFTYPLGDQGASALTTLVMFMTGYFTTPSSRDTKEIP